MRQRYETFCAICGKRKPSKFNQEPCEACGSRLTISKVITIRERTKRKKLVDVRQVFVEDDRQHGGI